MSLSIPFDFSISRDQALVRGCQIPWEAEAEAEAKVEIEVEVDIKVDVEMERPEWY